jgi:membrane protease YdiL (CAAX protease family)
MREMVLRTLSLACLVIASLLLMPFEVKDYGWFMLLLGASFLIGTHISFAKHIILIYISIGVLGLTPINTDIDLPHMLLMGLTLGTAVAIPYLVAKYVYKEEVIRYTFGKHRWTRGHIGYLLLAAVLSYLLLPFWMQSTGEFNNWSVLTDPSSLTLLFIGTNALGIWDELFFIVTVLALLRRHLPFWLANILQAIIFTGFLYELGFRGWAPIAIFPFAILQGLVFKKTENLLYIIAIHLTIDFVLYLALINAHHPHLLDIFVTG